MIRSNAIAAVVLVLLGSETSAGDGPLFAVRTDVNGIHYRNICGGPTQRPILEQNGQGVGIIDYDNDGRADIFVPNGSTESRWRQGRNPGCRLFRNVGGWRFQDVTEAAGVRGNAWSCGVAIADYDADGDFDIYVLNWGPNVLYRNHGDGTFSNVTDSAGVGDPRWSSSAAFADMNGDGLLDLYVSNYVDFSYDAYPTSELDGRPCLYRNIETGCGPWRYPGQPDTLYLNRGDGRFENASKRAGLDCTRGFRGFGLVAADLDGDHDVDIYVGCDVMPNLYLENQGQALFVSVGSQKGGALNLAGRHESGMGVAAADWGGDGSLDLMVTNFSGEKNTFYRNHAGYLVDDSAAIGFDRHRAEMGWGICVQDFNQDGRLDAFVANGHIYPQVEKLGDPDDRYAQPPRLYLGTGQGTLQEVPRQEAFGRAAAFGLRGCAAADLDQDGDLDLVAVQHNGPLLFFENLSNRPSLALDLVDQHGGRSPIGAQIAVDGGRTYWLLPNQGYQSSSDHRIHVALTPGAKIMALKVLWPDGRRSQHVIPARRSVVRLDQPPGQARPRAPLHAE
ncbi:MAG: CRTAC1 family protein [Phycisphaerae bacterium]